MFFYLKLFKRQTRLATAKLFCIAIMIACAVTFSISLVSDRLEQLFEQQSREVLAADLVLNSSNPISNKQAEIINQSAADSATTVVFQTMANNGQDFILASVKAVSPQYPLIGTLQISLDPYKTGTPVQHGPATGEIWIENRILYQLGLSIGDTLNIGEKEFTITQVLLYEPDRGSNFYNFTPRIMMHLDDVEETQVIQTGSRVQYNYLFSGNQNALDQLSRSLDKTLYANQKFVTINNVNQTLSTTLDRAYRFLHVASLIAILLGAVATSLVSYQYTQDMQYQYAILRCIGLRGKQLILSVLLPFVIFSLISIIGGLAIGAITHAIILNAIADILPSELPNASIKPYLFSITTVLIVIVSFTWPFLKNLIQTPPKLLLNNTEIQKTPWWAAIISALIGIFILVQLGISDIYLSIIVLTGIILFAGITYIAISLIVKLFIRFYQHRSIHARLATRTLAANNKMANIQIVAIGTTIFCLALVQTLRDDVLQSWQAKVPADAPNFFVLNLFEKDRQSFLDELESIGVEHSNLYPVARGRLTTINTIPVREAVTKESRRGDNVLNRDLALTSTKELPKDNVIVAGSWQEKNNDLSTRTVSIEHDLAKNLGLKMGDVLGFTIDTTIISATITSIRTVDWESFTPNFYIIFAPKDLDNLPSTYIGSFRLNQEQRHLIAKLNTQFPSTSFFDVDFLLKRIQDIARQISLAIEIILYFSLAAGISVFIAIELVLQHSRVQSTAIFKALGAQTRTIQKVFTMQFIMIGLAAGIFAYIMNCIIGFIINYYIINTAYVFNIKTLLLCLVITPALIVCSGYFAIRKTKQTSAKQLLQINS